MCFVNSSLTALNDDYAKYEANLLPIVFMGSSDFARFVDYNYIKDVCTKNLQDVIIDIF